MAPIVGKFAADFTPFYTAVTQATGKLTGLQTDAGKVGTSLDRMVNQFSGKKIIQDAALMEKALQELAKDGIGLTTAEMERMGKTAQEASEKMRAMGLQVPPGIQQIADATKKVEKATDDAAKSATNWKSQLAGLAGAVGVGFSIGAVVNFGKAVFDAAGDINDMADKLGISTDAVQGFKFAAEQGGSSLDAVGAALGKMNLKLSEGDKGTVAAVKELGLSFSDLRGMKPEDAFTAITDALKNTENQGDQTRLGVALMGKGFLDLLPAIKAGFGETSDAASKMSKQTIADLAAAGDAWESLYNEVVIFTGSMISEIMRLPATFKSAFSSMTGSVAGFKIFLSNAATLGIAQAIAMQAAIGEAQAAAAKPPPPAPPPPKPPGPSKTDLDAAAAALAKYKAEFDKFSGAAATAQLGTLDRIYRDLAASQKLTATNTAMLVKEAVNLWEAGGKLTPALQQLVISSGALGPGLAKGTLDLKDLGAQIKVTIPELSALDQWIKNVKVTAGLPGGKVKDAFSFDIETGAAALIKANETAARNARRAWENELSLVQNVLGNLGQQFEATSSASVQSLGRMLGGLNAVFSGLREAGKITTQGGKEGTGGILTPFFDADAKSADKWAAGISAGMTVVSGAMDVWRVASEAGTKSAGAFNGAMAGASAGAAFGPWGAAIGAAAGAMTGLIRSFTAGRRAVEDFAKSFDTAARGTGFDELRAKLNELGDEGERLWKKLTQQTGRGDKEGALRVQAEIEAALAGAPSALAAAAGYQTSAELQKVADDAKKTYDFMVASGQYSAGELARAFEASTEAQKKAMGDSSKAQQDELDAITKKYADTISALDSEIKKLSDSIAKEAPEEFMGIVEAQERARRKDLENQRAAQVAERDAELAAKQSTFDAQLKAGQEVDAALRDLFGKPFQMGNFVFPNMPTGGGGYVPSPGAGTGATAPGRVPGGAGGMVVLELDGRTLAEVVVPNMPGVITRYGLK